MALAPVGVIEVEPFPAKAETVWTEEEKQEFIGFLAYNPEAGDLIAGTGGLRKMRWSVRGRGKRGGVRVIYYFHDLKMPLFLLTLYRKNQKADLTAHDRKALRRLVDELKVCHGK